MAEVFDGLAKSAGTLLDVEEHRQFLRLEALVADVAEVILPNPISRNCLPMQIGFQPVGAFRFRRL